MDFTVYDSLIAKKQGITPSLTETGEKKSDAEIVVFNQENTTDNEHETPQNNAVKNPILDIKELQRKYKKDPTGVIEELGINFTSEQKAKLKSLIGDKKDLASVLDMVSDRNLNADDIVAGMEKVRGHKGSGFFKRVGNVFKTMFKDGVSDAWRLAKSEKKYYAGKLSENMDEIRTEREDFSSQGVAEVADIVTQTPKIKNSTMHFVDKDEIAGKKLYTEKDVIKAAGIMQENPDDAVEFTANAVELESIKNSDGRIKYKGSTIINVDEKMIENKDLQPTMMNTAKKSDMTDEYLVGITDHLVQTPEMQDALDSFLACKSADGKDKFSAENIFNQSSYMNGKNSETISNYQNNTLEMAKNPNINGSKIVSTAAEYTATSQNSAPKITENNSKNTYYGQPDTDYNQKALLEKHRSLGIKNPILNTKKSAVYDSSTIMRYMYARFGTNSEKILQMIEENPAFVLTLKKYGGNADIINALIKNPRLLDKITQCSSSITTEQLGKLVKECTSTEKTDMMLGLISEFGPGKALSMASAVKQGNKDKTVLDILNRNTISGDDKKEQIKRELNA